MTDRKLEPLLPDAMTSDATNLPPNPIQNRWALLVGIDDYSRDFSHLNFCVRDVQALETILKQLGYTVVCLHDRLDRDDDRFPTKNNIEAELIKLCQIVGSDDLLWVHFACHGALVDQNPVLIARDTRYATMAKTALALIDIENLMRNSKAKRLMLTLDACHVGVELGRDITNPEFIKNAYELAEGFALIAASTAQQIAQEWKEVEHGVFTYYLLEGLTGKADHANKGFVTVNDLQTFVVDHLKRWNINHGGRIQEPTFRADGRGDFMLGDHRKTAKPESVVPSIPAGGTATVERRETVKGMSQVLPDQSDPVKQALQGQLKALIQDFQQAQKQMGFTRSSVDRLRLKREADDILQQINEVKNQLNQL